MPVERSAGAIIFKKERGETLFLLLQYPSSSHRTKKDYWDLAKGHIEKGESEIETVKREVQEETGLKNIKFVKDFKETIKYFFRFGGKNILKFVTFYLAETKEGEVKISEEHINFVWLPYQLASERLTFKNAKNILKRANEFLSQKGL